MEDEKKQTNVSWRSESSVGMEEKNVCYNVQHRRSSQQRETLQLTQLSAHLYAIAQISN